MTWTVPAPMEWATQQFGSVNLRDERLNRRVVQVAGAMAYDPSGSIPKQNRLWKQTKGAYRLFDHKRATFESLSQPHWQATRKQCSQCQTVLLVQDTCWLSFQSHPVTKGLGWHGSTRDGRWLDNGLFLHGTLAIEPQEDGFGQVLGLAWNKLWARRGKAIGGDQQRRSKRRRSDQRESLRWSKAVTEIGAPPDGGQRWLHVGDREADIFELYRLTQTMAGVGFVVRVFRERNATMGHDTPQTLSRKQRRSSNLKKVCRSMPALGEKELWIHPRATSAGRWAKLSISGGAVTLWSPQLKGTGHALRCWAVRVWEPHPPAGEKAVEWFLLTSEPVGSLQQALKIAEYYTLRWLIEQYHQCLKSGCKVEERQLETADRLGPLIAMLCAVATRLLQLKHNARLTPDRAAKQCASSELVETLAKIIGADATTLSLRRFTHEVARLGGFLDRKHDGEPGWRTLWQGWHELSLINAGYQLAKTRARYG
jgi:hypothetical protein